ncbi:MAG: DUF5698 domain-containing protein, partial [bacterium]|nr:DUF5698 domain-containing protein [bacterium]
IFITRGMKVLATFLGFFEVLIWLLAISQIIRHQDHYFYFVAYAGGFAMGNYVGITIEDKIAMGKLVLRMITGQETKELIVHLKGKGYGMTVVDGHGAKAPVKLIYIIIDRRHLEEVTEIIKKFNPKAFYSVEDVRMAKEGVFPMTGAKRRSLI